MNYPLKKIGFARFAPNGLAALCLLSGLALPSGNAAAGVLAGPVVNPANGHRYYLLSQNNWAASEAEAVKLGGHLVTINDGAENDWVYNQFANFGGSRRHLWTGLNDRANEGVFIWSSGETPLYRSWSPGEPNNSSGVENCAHFWGYAWNDFNCDGVSQGGYPLHGVVEVSSQLKLTAFTASPTAGGAPLKVDFNVRATTGTGTSITQYIWDLNGDGRPDQITAIGKLSYLYKTAGVYNATVQVVNSAGDDATSNKLKITMGAAPELYGRIEYYSYDDKTKTARVKLRVYNSGLTTARPFKVNLVLSDNGQGATTVKTLSANALGARANVLLDFSQTFPESVHGRLLSVVIDSAKQVNELDEANNNLNISVGAAR